MFPGKGGGGGRVFLAGGGLKHEVGRWPLADLSPNYSMYYQFRARKTKSQVVAELFSAVYNLKISFQPDEIEMSIKKGSFVSYFPQLSKKLKLEGFILPEWDCWKFIAKINTVHCRFRIRVGHPTKINRIRYI